MDELNRIAVHSVPRSGSTWVGSIFDSHPKVVYKMQPLFSYAFKDRLSPVSDLEEINTFFEELELASDPFLDQLEGKKKNTIPSFSKTEPSTIVYKEVRYHHILKNLLSTDESIKIIGLIRNPFSVISSWLKAPKEFRRELGWRIDEEWRFALKKNLNRPEEFYGYEKWKEVTQLFLHLRKEFPRRFYLLKYEDLLKNTKKEVEKVFSFCNFELTPQTFDFIEKSSSINDADAYSVFKSKKTDDQWKKKLPSYIISEIKDDPDFKDLNMYFKWI